MRGFVEKKKHFLISCTYRPSCVSVMRKVLTPPRVFSCPHPHPAAARSPCCVNITPDRKRVSREHTPDSFHFTRSWMGAIIFSYVDRWRDLVLCRLSPVVGGRGWWYGLLGCYTVVVLSAVPH